MDEKIDYYKIKNEMEEELIPIWKSTNKHLSAPLEITIYPTLNCNLKCKFCFVKNKNKGKKEIDIATWLRFLREAKEMNVLSISILGGEPTRYEYIDELIKGINELKIKATITTNGIGIKESTKKALIECGYVMPVFSVQSFTKRNLELMGVDYTSVLETVEFMIQSGKEVRLNSVYTNQGIEEFCQIIDYCIEKGIRRYSIGVYIDINSQNENVKTNSFKDVRILDEKLQLYIVNKYGENKLELSVEGCMLYSGYPEFEHEIQTLSPFEQEYFGCRAGKSKLEIYSDGSVYPCICLENEITPTSNIKNKSLKEIWNNDIVTNAIRSKKTTNKECQKCGYNIICNSGCMAIKMKKYGNDFIAYKDPRCEIVHNEELK